MKIKIPAIFARKGAIIRVRPKSIDKKPGAQSQAADTGLEKKSTPALIDSLHDADPFVRSVSAEVLGRLKEKSSVEDLILALKDHSKYVREKAAIALGHIGDKSAVPALIERLNDESDEVRVTVRIPPP